MHRNVKYISSCVNKWIYTEKSDLWIHNLSKIIGYIIILQEFVLQMEQIVFFINSIQFYFKIIGVDDRISVYKSNTIDLLLNSRQY